MSILLGQVSDHNHRLLSFPFSCSLQLGALHCGPSHPPSVLSPSSIITLSINSCCTIIFPILRHLLHLPSLSFPSSITTLSILHHLLLHPPSLSFPLYIAALSALHHCPLHVLDSHRGWQHGATLGLEEPAQRLGSHQPSSSLHMTWNSGISVGVL